MSDLEDDTVEYLTGEQFAEKFFDPNPQTLNFRFGAATHPGNVRPNNEDHYAIVRRRRTSELILSNLAPDDLTLGDASAYALIVADGMGGASFGEFASKMALQTMFTLAHQATSWVTRFTDVDVQQMRERVDAYVQRIQRALRDSIASDPQLAGMGSTWTSVHIMPPHALVVHIGDSRAYIVHEGKMVQVTYDETVAQVFMDTGIPPEAAGKFRHLLLNNFGSDTERVEARTYQLSIGVGDHILLCTDGLTEMVSDEQIQAIVCGKECPQEACDELVSVALQNGGKDNVTVVLASVV